jgi:hypothetical protein
MKIEEDDDDDDDCKVDDEGKIAQSASIHTREESS